MEQELLEAELTATASQGEEQFDETDRESFVSRGIQVDLEVSTQKEVKYLSQYTGFKCYERFRMVLEFVLPDLDRDKTSSH